MSISTSWSWIDVGSSVLSSHVAGLAPVGRFARTFVAVLYLAGCAGTEVPPSVEVPPDLAQCVDPRPQLCTQDYRPVCGVRDAGASTERTTYGNACTACSNADVLGYSEGMCEE